MINRFAANQLFFFYVFEKKLRGREKLRGGAKMRDDERLRGGAKLTDDES